MNTKAFKEKLFFGIFRWFPIKKNTVLFKSFGGQYGDNPKYISELLQEKHPELKLVWAISNKSSDKDIPDYIKKIDIDSFEYIYYSALAEVVVDNMSGIRCIRGVRYIKWLNYFIKRKNQLNISTWHGTPLKKIGCDIVEDGISNYQTSANYTSAGNQYAYEIFERAFNGINIRMHGSPRNDILCRRDIDVRVFRKKLELPLEKKIILFAPTFRKSAENSGIEQIKQIDLPRFFQALNNQFGGEWVLVLRVHHEVLLKIHKECDGYIDCVNVFDGNAHDDMAEYLVACDVLLTDYSSSMFDYMLTKKPCFLFALDKDNYINDERGIYFPIERLPFSFSETIDELYQNIEEYSEEHICERIKIFLDEIGNCEDGHSSERIVKELRKDE